MAGIDNLKKRILMDDEERAKKIENEAAVRSREIISQAEQKAELLMKEAGIRAEKDGEDKKERIISRAGLDARNSILAAKQETIDNILKLAEDRILGMDADQYTQFIEKLLLNSIESGHEEVIFAEDDKKRIDSNIISRVNEKLSSQNKAGSLKLSGETRKIKSGFILKQGGVEMNCSIDSQIRILRDSLEGELVSLLFEKR